MGNIRLRMSGTIAVTLVSLFSLAACGSDDFSAGSRARPISAAGVLAYVGRQQAAKHGDSADVASKMSGYWTGDVVLGTRDIEVTGMVTAEGLVLLQPRQENWPPLLLRKLTIDGARFVGELVNTLASDSVLTVDGSAETGRFEALVLPPGWTRADYMTGLRIPTSDELQQFGRLHLSRASPPVPLSVESSGRVATATANALTLDRVGNLVIASDGCVGSGGVAPSPSIDGVLELAMTTAGAKCPLQGNLTGALHSESPGLVTVSLTDGDHSASVSLPWPPK